MVRLPLKARRVAGDTVRRPARPGRGGVKPVGVSGFACLDVTGDRSCSGNAEPVRRVDACFTASRRARHRPDAAVSVQAPNQRRRLDRQHIVTFRIHAATAIKSFSSIAGYTHRHTVQAAHIIPFYGKHAVTRH